MTVPMHWPETEADGPASLWTQVNDRGYAVVRAGEAASLPPAQLVERLLGRPAAKLDVVSIKPKPPETLTRVQQRSYTHTTVGAALHMDPDPEGVLPPHLVMMVCRRPAADGGESLLLDIWQLLEWIEAEEPELFRQLFETPRRIGFPGNDAFSPTIGCRQGNLVCFQGGVSPKDEVGVRFRRWVDSAPPVEVRPEAGDVLIQNNHRLLHGRRPFEDPLRDFQRILVWLPEPLAAPPRLLDRARAVSERVARQIEGEPLWVRQALGFDLESRRAEISTADVLGLAAWHASATSASPAPAPAANDAARDPVLENYMKRLAWYAAVPAGTPPAEVQLHLDRIIGRLGIAPGRRAP